MTKGVGQFLLAVLCFLLCRPSEGADNQYNGAFEGLDESYTGVLKILSNIPGFSLSTILNEPLNNLWDNIENTLALNQNVSGKEICYLEMAGVLLQAVYFREMWAIKMFDSFGKLPPGLLTGAITWPGDYKECIDIQSPKNESIGYDGFRGQYCSIVFPLPIPQIPISITTGICLPDSCKAEYFFNDSKSQAVLQEYTKNSTLTLPFKNISQYLNISSMTCQPKSVEWTSAAIGYLFVLSVFGLLTLLGSMCSVYEYFKGSAKYHADSLRLEASLRKVKQEDNARIDSLFKLDGANNASENLSNGNSIAVGVVNEGENKDEITLMKEPHVNEVVIDKEKQSQFSTVVRFLKCFSIFTNGAKILNTENTQNQLGCLHGIRFLSMTWIILCHTYIFMAVLYSNLFDTLHIVDTLAFQVVMRGFVSVDSFFVLSGFLLAWLFLKEVDKNNGKINWVMFYVHRFWRLTPVYLIVMGFYVTIPVHLVSGPFAKESGDAVTCKKNWWWNLLYINNFTSFFEVCMGWMWYIANDMQFYVISPIFLYFLWRRPKIGLSIMSALLVTCWISSGAISVKWNISPLLTDLNTGSADSADFQLKMADVFNHFYIKPYVRIGPYLVGAFFGYLLYKTEGQRNFLTLWQQTLAWAVAIFFGLSIIYGLYHADITPTLSTVYNTFSCTAWGLAVGWVIYACLTGHADIINGLLSWNGWLPLSRLTYCAYLIHPIVMYIFIQGFQTTLYVTHATIVGYFATFLLWTYGFSFVVSVLFEAPLMALEKILLKK